MPGMNGFELQRLLGVARPELPVILLTARHELVGDETAAPNNRGILHKPFKSTDLLAAVRAALEGVP